MRLLAAALLFTSIGAPRAAQLTPERLANNELTQVTAQVKSAEDNLRVVETQYVTRGEPSKADRMERRFSDGEIQYLLGDWPTCSVLLYDLVSMPGFESSPHAADALYDLADSLYQQGNLIGARLYLRQLLARDSKRYKAGLQRYLDIAGKLNDFTGIDGYILKARALEGGNLPDELAYVYGKWLFKRKDLKRSERLNRADEVFRPLAAAPASPFRLQSRYFLAVAQVERGAYDDAVRRFLEISGEKAPPAPRDSKIRELANLSLARVYAELGKYPQSVDRYQEIPRDSEYYPDALYETAWAQVRAGNYQGASNAVEILELVAPDSTLKPQADLLHGHLLLKLHKYKDATDSYNALINTYAPIRDEIDALLSVNKDPVAYFDALVAKSGKTLDVNAVLPPVAVRWATTQEEVANAVHMANDIENGRHGTLEAEDVAHNILKALDERGLEAFPTLQEGYVRADAVASYLAHSEQSLVRVETQLNDTVLTSDERQTLRGLQETMNALQQRFDTMPKNERERELRKTRMEDRVDALDKQSYRLGYEIQGMAAILTALQKWAADSKESRHSSDEDEKDFSQSIAGQTEMVELLRQQMGELREKIRQERATAATSLGGDSLIRNQLLQTLKDQHALLATAGTRLPSDRAGLFNRAAELHARIAELQLRTEDSKRQIQGQVLRLADEIREKVAHERELLGDYGHEVQQVSADARQVVGRIAFDSFRRVRQQFYELVLKADVGVVDVAFTQKQNQTVEIQKLSQTKERHLKALDDEFKEVLKDVD